MIRPMLSPLYSYRYRLLAFLLAIAGLAVTALAPVGAQPLTLPGAQPPTAASPPNSIRAPQTERPVLIKTPSEEALIGKNLKFQGRSGALALTKAGRNEILLRLTIEGTLKARPDQSCTVPLSGADGVKLSPQGRVQGAMRYEAAFATCPITLDILDDAVLVSTAPEACLIQDSDCAIAPSGLWGPAGTALLSSAKIIDRERGQADKAVRDNYRFLTQKAAPSDVRAIVSEQAAFSAEREMFCRTYAGENQHGFCHARFAQKRAAALAARFSEIKK
jgi:hypothetical protein